MVRGRVQRLRQAWIPSQTADLRQLKTKMDAGFSQIHLEVNFTIAEVKADLVRWLIGS